MKMRKSFLMILLSFLLFMAVGCSNQKQEDKNDGNNNDKEPNNEVIDEYVPRLAVPDNLPIYPNAILFNEIEGMDGHWTWLFTTDGSANDIIAFFTGAFAEMGVEVDYDKTIAMKEEFFVHTHSKILRVFWLDDGIIDATPDTPNRWYGIIVNLEAW